MTGGARRPRVLLVEDEAIVAMLVEDMLDELGCDVAATAGNLAEALALAGSLDVDFAVLDVNLHGKPSLAVAAALRARGIRFAFATGYGHKSIAGPFADAPVLQKPFELEQLAQVVASLR